ncbi:MAG TPA: flagellar hook-basal body complex protein FliE [Terriglobales bacterium]|jgi:flagellar hook-basal body complex protein FliE
MSNPVSPIRILPVEIEPLAAGKDAQKSAFMETLEDAIEQVQNLQGQADQKVEALLAGNGSDVHSAMIAVEKADLSFQLMMQVRNKIVQAYQEISRMQF